MPEFHYIRCDKESDDEDNNIDDENDDSDSDDSDDEITVTGVVFNISRYGQVQETLHFDKPISIDEAIKRVERYLSEPITSDYFDHVKDDLFASPNAKMKYYTVRGDCLTDCKFLERKWIVDGILHFACGSYN